MAKAQSAAPNVKPPEVANSQTQDDHEDEDDDVPTDPNAVVEIEVFDVGNAGRTPSSRWGDVPFDAEGYATIKLPLKDVHHLHSMRWLSEDDQQRYLGLEAAQPASTDSRGIPDAEFEAVKGANVRLAQRNAELEGRISYIETMAKREVEQYVAGKTAEIEALKREHAGEISVMQLEINSLRQRLSSKPSDNDAASNTTPTEAQNVPAPAPGAPTVVAPGPEVGKNAERKEEAKDTKSDKKGK